MFPRKSEIFNYYTVQEPKMRPSYDQHPPGGEPPKFYNSVRSTLTHTVHLKYTYTCPRLPSCLFPSGFATKIPSTLQQSSIKGQESKNDAAVCQHKSP